MTITIALSKGRMLVFDGGRIVEHGHHLELVALGGVYASLHESWIGATRSSA